MKLSELIERRPTKQQYETYADKVAEWTVEAYNNLAFKLYRPDAKLSTDEDKYLYSLEVTLLKEGYEADWESLEELYILNNFDPETASMAISKAIEKQLDDDAISVVSHSVSHDNITNLTGTGPYPITGSNPVGSRIYFVKVADRAKVKEAGKENNTDVVFADEVDYD